MSPRALHFIVETMAAAERVYHDHRAFPELGGPRSERREALVRVVKALIYHLDIVTLRVGKPQDDGRVVGLTVELLAKRTGLSPNRAERALRHLRFAGFSTSKQPRDQKQSGDYVGLPSVRTVTPLFFSRLGLTFRLEIERDKATKKRRRLADETARLVREQEQQLATTTPMQLYLRATQPPSSGVRPSDGARRRRRAEIRREHPDWPAHRVKAIADGELARDAAGSQEERTRRRGQLQLALRLEHPDWPTERVRAEAEAELKREEALASSRRQC